MTDNVCGRRRKKEGEEEESLHGTHIISRGRENKEKEHTHTGERGEKKRRRRRESDVTECAQDIIKKEGEEAN